MRTSPPDMPGMVESAFARVGSESPGFVRIKAQTRSAVTVTPGSAGFSLGRAPGPVSLPVRPAAGGALAPSVGWGAAPGAAGLAWPFAAGAGAGVGDSNRASTSFAPS